MTNLGLQDLVVTSIGLASETDFTFEPGSWTGGTLTHGQSETFAITLDTSAGTFGTVTYEDDLLIETDDANEGIAAFLEKRSPKWKNS